MKPIRITMTAFGPYKDEQIIDFTELDNNQLFVISGPTGSGKTTIFDAISYALYGQGSGTDRDNAHLLRSQFAEEDLHTSVDFIFEQHSKHYRVFRQLPHLKKGNKHPSGAKCEFYEIIGGEEFPAVDRQQVTEINQKIEQLIGLTNDQFRQIVMLPQGEFRKLLTSETRNKEAILRQIFKTEKYKQLTEQLREKRSEVNDEFTAIKMKQDSYIEQIKAKLPARDQSKLFNRLAKEHYTSDQLLTGLAEEITYYEERVKTDKEALETAYKKQEKAQASYHEARATNERFKEYDEKQKSHTHLQEQEQRMKAKEKKLIKADKASQITPYETQVADWTNTVEKTKASLIAAEGAKQKSTHQLKQAEKIYTAEKAREPQREEINKKLDELLKFLPDVEQIDEQKGILHGRERRLTEEEKSINEMQEGIKQKRKELTEQRNKINQAEEKVIHLPAAYDELSKALEEAEEIKKYCKLAGRFIDSEKLYKEKEKALQAMEKDYNQLEESWLKNQAVMLASHLHDGEACPVCGSAEHPRPATEEGDVITREELDRKRQDLRREKDLFEKIAVQFQSVANQLKDQELKVIGYGYNIAEIKEEYERLIERGGKLRERHTHLQGLHTWLTNERKAFASAEEKLDRLVKSFDEKREAFQKRRSEFERDEAVFRERIRSIPEEMRDLAAIKGRVKELREQKRLFLQAWDRAQDGLQKAKDHFARAETNLVNVTGQLKDFEEKLSEAKAIFMEKLTKSDFVSVEDYLSAKMSEIERDSLRKEIDDYKQQVVTLAKQLADLRELLKGKERVDLEELAQEVSVLKDAYEQALQRRNLSSNLLKEAKDIKERMEEGYEEIKVQEKRLQLVQNLYDLIRGENDRKISFERYLQIDYLEQILEAANVRLYDMSNGQYFLKHSSRQESYGAQSGLALDVYDAYTGLDRDVKTLSGGEKFNASLCLALGVSDVIQSYQGNVVIDTMFIDEGFGSLDEETLQKAIETIVGLQETGRMIGVISHVNELKDAFPAVLQVEKSKEGYSRARFIVD